MLTFLKFRIKHPKTAKRLKEARLFFSLFIIIFLVVFTIFNGRSFYEQVKYTFRLGFESVDKFVSRLPLGDNRLYDMPDTIIVPKLNIQAPIISPQNADNKAVFSELENGTVHYPLSVEPGQVGNSIILGHSSAYPWYRGQYGSVFSLLNRLDEGDEIIVFYQKHKYIYRVTNRQVVNKNALVVDQSDFAQITLLSCWPVGTNWNRMMIKGELTRE